MYFQEISISGKNTRSIFFPVDYTIGGLGFLLVDQSEVIISGERSPPPYKGFNSREEDEKERDPDQVETEDSLQIPN